MKRKLIEVALPLEAINRESAREKSIRNGHPTAMHLWWARRPLVTCRSLLFAQLVDDPSGHPDRFPTEEAQALERRRLFDLIERLASWDNSGDPQLLAAANREINTSTPGTSPTIVDPFAGGGAIPLEAQRLGLHFVANDLNPVAVLINRMLTEIPAAFTDCPPVNPANSSAVLDDTQWRNAIGLAEDYRHYATWMLDEARRRLGHLYPPVVVGGQALPVISWIWARTIPCTNPACRADVVLAKSFWLSRKKGRETFVEPRALADRVVFTVVEGRQAPFGTVTRTGATCLVCGSSASLKDIQRAGVAGRMGKQLLAVAALGKGRRVYVTPGKEHWEAFDELQLPHDAPDEQLSTHPQYMGPPRYGMTKHSDVYTARQLTALVVFTDLVRQARERVLVDAENVLPADGQALRDGGRGATAYADAIATLLAFTVDRLADMANALCGWEPIAECPRHLFGKQTVSMVWDFAEGNPLGSSSGSWKTLVDGAYRAMLGVGYNFPRSTFGAVRQGDARVLHLAVDERHVINTDPPYYDNVPYSDLADFFYVWLRRSLQDVYPDELATVLTPKKEELVADSQRLGSRAAASAYFRAGFERTFANLLASQDDEYPAVVYYAFKQVEGNGEEEVSTGWETLLDGLLRSGWSVTATWPVRTENASRMRGQGANALASSIALSCRRRPSTAEVTTRRNFLRALKAELPTALRNLQQGSIAPVDLAQAAIGPGMAVFSRYANVIEADGSGMSVRTALALINQVLDEVLTEQEGDFDADTRFCVKWFSQFGWDETEYGHADQLSRSTNTSVDLLVRGGIFWARAGRARLLAVEDLATDWAAAHDPRVAVWEAVLRLAKRLDEQGAEAAAHLMADVAQRVDLDAAKELAYLLYSLCDKRGWTQSALLFNGLGTSWSDLSAAARAGGARTPPPAQGALEFDETEG